MSKERTKALRDLLWDADDVPDLERLDGLDDGDDQAARATEMLSFRVDAEALALLRKVADRLGVGHTILARELLLAGLQRLRTLVEE